MSKEPQFPKAIAYVDVLCKDCGEQGKVARRGPKPPFFNWLFSFYACRYCGSRRIEVVPPTAVNCEASMCDTLRWLLREINIEITRYRDYEWKIVVWSVALSWGLFLFSSTKTSDLFQGSTLYLTDVLTSLLIFIGTVLLSAHLLFIHGELTTNRNWRRQIERALGLYNQPSILPARWRTSLPGYYQGRDTFIIPFILFMMITGFSLGYAVLLRQPIPRCVVDFGSVAVTTWCGFVPFIVTILIVIELYYVVKAVLVQGLGQRDAY